MKETTTINISGIIFHIDQDAFVRLKNYFAELKKRFGDNAEGKEIINDIELRIAEILQEKITDKKQVVNEEDIAQIIKIMGAPEDIDADTEEEFSEDPVTENRQRRLFRDPDNTVLGGVCSGMAHYFGIDPVLMRVLTVIVTIFYGVGFLVYIVLWAFIPKAETTAQKLEMKGEPVTANNIKRTIKENYEDVKNSGAYKKARDGVNRGASAAGEIVSFILKAIVIIIGIGMVTGAVVSIVAIVNLVIFHSPTIYFHGEVQGIFFPVLEAFFENELTLIIFLLSSILLALIPILVILFLGVKLVFNFKTNNKVIGLSALGIWLISLAAVITIGISLGARYTYPSDVEETHVLDEIKSETIYINLNKFDRDLQESFGSVYISENKLTGTSYLYNRPDFDVRKSRNDNIEIEITKTARGRSRYDAQEVASAIKYNYTLKDSILYLDPWYETELKNVGRVDDLDITLYLPEGKKIYFDREIYPVVYDIENVKHISDYDMMGKTWIMQPEGLIEYKPDSVKR
ncbi:DNA-binding transcriptional activator PspC [Salinivirga cyanobacteriivorans]|uniref:DNA-binding transcriptional activator PspC n=1 Tax=Salinivirga cyanobacteriivorans TaxID=1307839 RepID=A0A0S2I0V7_9BACT|nr:PspC domain-containing protein [Salinivirga cyanobacteriivorans]ALO15992.1 DNA-binding transcriptional activator PspC [Salinivirga cyanobacteriivorans]